MAKESLLLADPDDSEEREDAPKLVRPRPAIIRPLTLEANRDKPSLVAAPAAETPLEHTSPLEDSVINHDLALDRLTAQEAQPPEPTSNPEAAASHQAAGDFLRSIVDDGQDPDTALREALALWDAEPEDAKEPPEAPDFEPTAAETPQPKPPDNPPAAKPSAPAKRSAPQAYGPRSDNARPRRAQRSRAPIVPNAVRSSHDRQPGPAGGALPGGLVGYLVGRRHGRIKSEKRLLPIQNKLEERVTDLQQQLQDKEDTIRRAAAEQVRAHGPAVIEKAAQAAQAAETKRQSWPERLLGRGQLVLEAARLRGPGQTSEHLGHMLMAVEAIPAAAAAEHTIATAKAPEVPAQKAELSSPNPAAGKRIDTLGRSELLSLSEKVIVDGSSLRQIYETSLVGEQGLRRLVAEHMRGGDLNKALRREIVEREIDFERDPVMRDMAVRQLPGGGGVASNDTLHQLLQKATISLDDNGEEAAFFKARANYEANQLIQHKKRRRTIDISLIAAIIVLLAAIIALYLSHK
jgi:hypothetical protein